MSVVASIQPSATLVALATVPLIALAAAVAVGLGLGAGAAVVGLGAAGIGAVAFGTRGRIVVDAAGVTYTSGFHRHAAPWSEVAGLGITEVLGGGVWWYEILLRDGSGMRFTSAWRDGDRAAACIQRRRPDVDAPLDRRGPATFDPATDTTTARPDVAEALGVPWPVAHRWLDVVEAELASFGGRLDRRQLQLVTDTGVLELFAMGRAAVAQPEAEWPALVRAHGERIRALQEQEASFRLAAADLSRVEARLRPRLHAIDRIDGAQADVVAEVGPHLRAFVVVLLESGELIVPHDILARWGPDPRPILGAAARRLADDPAPAVHEHDGYVALIGDAGTASRLLALADHVDLDPRYGAIVAAPDQHVLLVWPVSDIADVMALTDHRLSRAARAAYEQGARPLTPELYWWFRGEVVHVPQIPDGAGAVSLLIPDGLTGRLTGRIDDAEAAP